MDIVKGNMGWIEVIVGPMFSGKSEELIRRLKRAEIVPIQSVDDRVVGSDGRPGPITRRIQEVFHGAVRGQVDRYKDWLEHVG